MTWSVKSMWNEHRLIVALCTALLSPITCPQCESTRDGGRHGRRIALVFNWPCQ